MITIHAFDTEKADDKPILTHILPARYLRLRSISQLSRRIIWIFTPDVFRPDTSSTSTKPTTIRPTAYLDGLRGLACIAVLNFHYILIFTRQTGIGYGYSAANKSPMQLPFVRVLYDGATAVSIFFTVAGYVCSVKALQLMGKAQHEKTLRTLCGSTFRSAFRLYLPVLVVSFIYANAVYFGAGNFVRPIAQRERFSEPILRQFDSWSGQMYLWAGEIYKLTDLWNISAYYSELDKHLWSIPFEFRMRIHLYLVLLGLALCKPMVRLCGLVAVAALYFWWDRWEGPAFFLGAALAQWDLIKKERNEKADVANQNLKSTSTRRFGGVVRVVRLLLYIASLYLMSFPIKNPKYPAPGFIWMNNVIPRWISRPKRVPKSIGVFTLLYLLGTVEDKENSLWHRALTSRFAQHMGKIMYAVYLIHGPVAYMFSLGVPSVVWSHIGRKPAYNWWTGIVIGWGGNLLISLWLAEVFTREIDSRIGRLTQWCESKLLVL